MEKRDNQSQILLSLSDEIVRIRGKEDMLDIILHKLKKYIQFDDSFILRYNKEKRTCWPYIYYSKKARSKNSEYKTYLDLEYHVADDTVEDINYPQVYKVAMLLPLGTEQINFMHNSGIKEFAVIKLIEGNQLRGLFILLSEQTNSFKPEDLDLLHRISYQISAATANIIANEEIAKREEEKTILLSLSDEIASLKDRNDLNRIVNTRIKKLFSIKQFGIAQINEDRVTHSAFMMDLGDPIHNHNDFSEVTTLKYSITDTAFSTIMASDDPVILDVLQLAKEPNPPTYVHFWEAVGFRELLCLALRVGGNNIGCIFFNIDAIEINNLSTNLLKGVCAQLSVAVSNIIANEKIKKADEEKSLLLSFSNEIATVRDKKGLRLIIKQYLKNIFHIKEYIITTRNIDHETYSHFLHDANADDPTDEGWKIMTGNRIPIKGDITGAVLQSEEPVTFIIDDILQEGKPYFPAASFWKAAGAKELMGLRLKVADRDVGLLLIQPGQVNNQLLKGISAQLAIAIANVAANEEIVSRENERELLLSLNLDIAGVRSNQELLTIINQKLKILLGFSHTAIAMINDDKTTARVVLLDPESKSKNHPDYMKKNNYPIEDGVLPEVLTSRFPFVYDLTNLNKNSDVPVYFKVNRESGMEQAVMVRFSKGDAVLGVWVIIYAKKITLEKSSLVLIEGLANQMSIALSNIIANEEIIVREEEKATLLALSHKIAVVRNKSELLELLNMNLKKLFPITGFGITLENEDGKTHSAYVVDVQKELRNVDFKKAITQTYSITDGVYDSIIIADKPVALQVDELAKMAEKPAYVEFWEKTGIKKVVGIAVRVGEKNLGCFIVLQDNLSNTNVNDNLLKGVCAQISVAISNIRANEEIIKREEEKSILLSISHEIAILRNRNDLFQVVNRKLKGLFLITEFGIAHINGDRETYSAFTLDLKETTKSHSDFNSVTSAEYSINDPLFSKVMNSDEPVIFDVNELSGKVEVPAYVDFWRAIGLQRVLCVALRVGGKNIGCAFLHIDTNPSINQQTNLLKGVCAQLSVAISNILAHEEIERREKEREFLLSLNMNMAAVRNNDDLMVIITQRLKKIFPFSHAHLVKINDDRTTVTPYLYDPESKSKNHPRYKELKGGKFTIQDGILDKSITTPYPTIVDLEKLQQEQVLPLYAQINFDSGIKQIVNTRFTKDSEIFGFWMMFFDKEIVLDISKSSLIKGISDQISIALSNIIANDEIQHREKEKSKLLAFSNILTSTRDKGEIGKILTQQFIELFETKGHYMIYALSIDKQTYYPLLFDPDASPSNLSKDPEFEKQIKTDNLVSEGILEKILTYGQPMLFDVKERFKKPMTPAYEKMMNERGIIKITGAPIKLGDEDIGVILFDTNNESLGRQQHLFSCICAQIAITVSNLIANEKIINQLNEINKYKQQLEEEKIYLKEEIETAQNFAEIIGESEEMRKVFLLVEKVAPSESTVLLLGETGTGKELIARAIHNASPRKSKLMVKVNCAAIPPNLIESDLFGHERGSFTGATERRIGKFELAHQGTLFLDEIGEMPLEMQVKLLRALQEKEIERVGGKTTIKVDVRIIAATNRDLEKFMEEGKFRSDLYYRLNIFPISMPPLRNRKEDIPSLALHFVRRFSKKAGRKTNTFSEKAMQELIQYNWPGNIRELEHLIERSILLATSDTIKEIHLPVQKKNLPVIKEQEDIPIKTIDENERDYILKVLKRVKGKVSGEGGAAELLGIPPSTLNSRMKRLGIRKEHFG